MSSIMASGADIEETYCYSYLSLSGYIPQFYSMKPWEIKGAMSPHTHARANENKLEKVGPSFSSSVGDFGRLFLSV